MPARFNRQLGAPHLARVLFATEPANRAGEAHQQCTGYATHDYHLRSLEQLNTAGGLNNEAQSTYGRQRFGAYRHITTDFRRGGSETAAPQERAARLASAQRRPGSERLRPVRRRSAPRPRNRRPAASPARRPAASAAAMQAAAVLPIRVSAERPPGNLSQLRNHDAEHRQSDWLCRWW